MFLELTNKNGDKFLINSDFVFEVEENKSDEGLYNSVVRLINDRECFVKETFEVIRTKLE